MLEIIIPMPAISLNHSHMVLKRGGRIKKPETRKYEEEFTQHLLQYSDDITYFLRSFDPDNMGLSVDYEFYFPSDQYFNKKGKLNLSKLPDTDNLIKITQDLVFSPITNDAHVVELSARKLPTGKDAYIRVEIDAIPLPREYDI